jgi:hypothetical protein
VHGPDEVLGADHEVPAADVEHDLDVDVKSVSA